MKQEVSLYTQDEMRKRGIDKLRKQETAKIYMHSMNLKELQAQREKKKLI